MDNLPKYIGFIQFDVIKGDWQKNLASVTTALDEMKPAPGSLIILPELWGAGFDYKNLAQHAETTNFLLEAIAAEAKKYGIILAGSLVEVSSLNEEPIYHNSLYFVGEDGVLGKYRKQHLFAPMGEAKYFAAGDNPKEVQLSFGKAAGLVCFDLRFPELIKIQTAKGAKILVVSAQWPLARVKHWQTLLKARAIENQIYVVACNRCGSTDGLAFGGNSMIVSPDGQVLHQAGEAAEAKVLEIDQEKVNRVREAFNTTASRPYRLSDSDKIKDMDVVAAEIESIKNQGGRVVFTNGCFDILHAGHVTYLEQARRQGDYLVLGLNSDTSVKSIKGPSRPVNNQESRARVLASLGCIDRIVTFDEDTPFNLITTLMPNVLVKGADWPIDQIVGGKEVLAAGGQVINIPMVESFSTTNVIEKIKNEA